MALGRPVAPVELTDTARRELKAWAQSRSLPAGQVRRARIILLAADDLSNTAIANKVGISGSMVGMWRKRYLSQGMMTNRVRAVRVPSMTSRSRN